MFSKHQALVVVEGLIATAQARVEERRRKRLVVRAGPLPPGVSLEQFASLVQEAEARLLWHPALWGLVAAWVGGASGLLGSRATALVPAYLSVGFVVLMAVRRKLIAREIRGILAGSD